MVNLEKMAPEEGKFPQSTGNEHEMMDPSNLVPFSSETHPEISQSTDRAPEPLVISSYGPSEMEISSPVIDSLDLVNIANDLQAAPRGLVPMDPQEFELEFLEIMSSVPNSGVEPHNVVAAMNVLREKFDQQ